MRPTYAEIGREALVHNYTLLDATVQRHAGKSAGLLAVIKANAYGHGVVLCGQALAAAGAPWLGVTSVEEALQLRNGLRSTPQQPGMPRATSYLAPRILAMSGFWPGEEGALLQSGITPQVWEGWHFSLLDAAGRRAGLGARSIPVHLEVDTGMSRQGVPPGAALAALLASAGLGESDSPLWIEGVLTHFSSPGADSAVMQAQIDRFAEALAQLRIAGIRPPLVHAGNSINAGEGAGLTQLAALARAAGASLLARPGLALYGIGPIEPAVPAALQSQAPQTGGTHPATLRPVMTWKTEITSLRDIQPGTSVGYDETFIADRPMRLALVPVGYADGLNRLLSGRGSMLVRGQRVPIVGRVSMDQTVLDVTTIPQATLGDPVVVLGSQTGTHGSAQVPAEEHAALCGTIPYEILCAVAARVQRIAV